jgi:hypothetical protein
LHKYIAICVLIALGITAFALIAAPEGSLDETGRAAMQSGVDETEKRRVP